jgi:pimeloyl-ACP methyl ester carboxylesterase
MSAGEEQRRPPAMHLEVTGSGRAVVLTHGFADDSTTFDALAGGLGLQPDSLVLDGLSTIELPVLVVVGGDDRRYHPGSRVIAAEVPGADLVVIEGAGHFAHRSHAAEVHGHVRDFLARTAA